MSTELDAALVTTAREIIVEDGFATLTIDALVKRVGTTRPAFYRRYKGLSELVMQLLRDPLPHHEDLNTGTLHGDLHVFTARISAYLSNPVVRRALPSLLMKMTVDPCVAPRAQEQFFGPQVEILGKVLDRAVSRGEIVSGADPATLFELLTGPSLARTLLNVGLPDAHLVAATVTGALGTLTEAASS